MDERKKILEKLPGLDCGLCGYKSCWQFSGIVLNEQGALEKCVHLSDRRVDETEANKERRTDCCIECELEHNEDTVLWKDSLGREYDFILDTFANEPGPRETIIPHNPARTKELDVKTGDIIIGRPLGMSCGCPITHCGIVMSVDEANGVMVWCVTGPLGPRSKEYKDIGYYSAEAYEGIVKTANKELKIGMRYWFLPRRCMLQWRHSGLVNFINKRGDTLQIRIEGLFIG